MLLVDDDQPEVAERREHGRAGADADARLAGAQAQPLVVALALPERRVQHRDDVAEAGLEAPTGLRRERDLGHQHDRAASGLRAPPGPRAGRPRSCPSRSRRGAGSRSAGRCRRCLQRRSARRAPPPGRRVSGGGAPARRPTGSLRRPPRPDAPARSPPGRGPRAGAGRWSELRGDAVAPARSQRLEQRALAVGERARAVVERALARPRSARRPAPARTHPLRREPGGEHQAERAGRRRAVLARPSTPRARPARRESKPRAPRRARASRSGSSSDSPRELDDHARARVWRPNGTRRTEPIDRRRRWRDEPVVERPSHGTGAGERLRRGRSSASESRADRGCRVIERLNCSCGGSRARRGRLLPRPPVVAARVSASIKGCGRDRGRRDRRHRHRIAAGHVQVGWVVAAVLVVFVVVLALGS